jgi:hypothetical protein
MTRRNQQGSINGLLIPFILVLLLLIGAGVFGVWAFNGRQDYKNHTDQKIAAAVTTAQQQTAATDAAQFAEANKKPLKPYTGPEAYGSIIIKYPKSWSGYVSVSDNGSTPLDGYFQPDVVPNIQAPTATFALRLQVVQTSYDQVVSQYSSQVQQKTVTVTPYKAANVPSIVGVRVDGQVALNKQGSMILLPLRDKTLKLWTESTQFEPDFNNNILPNFSFSP